VVNVLFDTRPRHRRTRIILLYSPGGPNLKHRSLGSTSPHPKQHVDRFIRFYPRDARLAMALCLSVCQCTSRCSVEVVGLIELVLVWRFLSTSSTLYFKEIQVYLQK